jgi:hypothetical protein
LNSRLRSGALLACALIAVVAGGRAATAADSTTLGLSVETSPLNPTPGTVVTFTATVTPALDSTGLDVTCNLSWAGLGASAPLTPDAGGLVFTRDVTVRSNAVPGERVGSCKATDDQSRLTETGYSITIVPVPTDDAPTLTSHTPDGGESDVAPDAKIGVVFSEPVDVTGSWYLIECDSSGVHTAVVSGGPTSYLLDPNADFSGGEECTVTLDPTLVTDQDTVDPPDSLAGTSSWTFTTAHPVNQPPSVSAASPYSVDEGGSVALAATGSDPEGGPLSYAWDLDNNGTYETPGQSQTFSASALDGPSSRTVGVQVTDAGGLTATATATVNIGNVAPTASFAAPSSAPAGFQFTLSLTSPNDPSGADTTAGFTYAFDCGTGYGTWGSAPTATCPIGDVGTRSVAAKIRDKDGGVTEYQATVQVTVTFGSLCDLVRAYASDPKVADDLCAKLAQAEAAPTANAREGLLGAFGNQVDAKTGKGLTSEQADQLKLLSMRLI